MNYSETQIKKAKESYNSFMQFTTVEAQQPEIVGINEAEQRSEYHNNIVTSIRNGNKELEKKWKLFFLSEEVKYEQKAAESKAKLKANKKASADILAPIKSLKKLGDFGKWLNDSSNPFRKQHFNKKYTSEAVDAFLETL